MWYWPVVFLWYRDLWYSCGIHVVLTCGIPVVFMWYWPVVFLWYSCGTDLWYSCGIHVVLTCGIHVVLTCGIPVVFLWYWPVVFLWYSCGTDLWYWPVVILWYSCGNEPAVLTYGNPVGIPVVTSLRYCSAVLFCGTVPKYRRTFPAVLPAVLPVVITTEYRRIFL